MLSPRGDASWVRADTLVQVARGLNRDRSDPGRPYRDVRISLGKVEDGTYNAGLSFATGTPDLAFAVDRGEIDLAAVNPSAFLTMAYRGTGPFSAPLAVRAIAVMPSWDGMAFAVTERTGVRSLAEIRDRRIPLRLSIRGNPAHATRFVIDQALTTLGFSLADIEGWGGKLEYVDTPSHPDRLKGIEDGSLDAVFDEGIKGWGPNALNQGMRFLPLEAAVIEHFGRLGWPVIPIPRTRLPALDADLLSAASFSGWPLFTHASLPDSVAYQMVAALDAARELIAWDWPEPVSLADLSGGTDFAPRDVPLHPGAERYYREHGAL